MTQAFADTSYFLALLIPGDPFHTVARGWAADSNRPLVTTDYGILEVGNFLAGPRTRHLFAAFMDIIRTNSRMRLIGGNAVLLGEACALYLDRRDKAWSLTDCASFIVMRRLALLDALTADLHFRQAGFNPMLLPA